MVAFILLKITIIIFIIFGYNLLNTIIISNNFILDINIYIILYKIK